MNGRNVPADTRAGTGAGGETPPALAPATADIYRQMVSAVRDYAIFALDRRGHIATWNPGAERIKGWSATEIVGKHFSIFYPPEDLAWNKPQYELEVAAVEGRFEDEGWRLRRDGSRFWANVTITTIYGDAGEVLGYTKVTRDLTERRRAEDALRASEERFRTLVHSVRDYGIFMLDVDGSVASWNEGAERINGYTASEILGRHFATFYPEEDRATRRPERELDIALERGRFEDEGWRVRKDGKRFWANVVITPLHAADGSLMGFANVTRDLSERREAQIREVETARQLARVEEASRAKSEFLAAMSHELRTPLNAIAGYVDLLLLGVRGRVSDEQRADLERIQRSERHLLAVINDLLNYSRLEAGRIAYDVAPVAAAQVLDSVASMIVPQARTRGVDFEVLPCAPELCVIGDRPKIEQILLNLLSNAVKFTPAGGRVRLGCASADGQLRLCVQDTGVGIPRDKLESVFEPFVQLDRSLTSSHEGTGLGLAISRDLARGMNGELTAESTLGAGSTFTLTLPSGSRSDDTR